MKSHSSHESCGNHCLGAIPRNSQYVQQQQQHNQFHQYSNNSKRSANHYTNKNRLNDIQNRLPPIKEFRSPTKVPMISPAHLLGQSRLRYVRFFFF